MNVMRIPFPSLLQTYRNFRIRHKIFLLVLLIMSGCFAATYAGFQYASNVYDEQIYETSSRMLNLSSNLVESELKKVTSLSFNVAMDPDIQKGLMKVKDRASEYDRLQVRDNIVSRLAQYAGNQPYLYAIEIVDMNKSQYVSGFSTSYAPEKLDAMIRTAAEGGGEDRWVYPSASDPALALVKQIRSYDNFSLEPIGTLIVRIKMDSIVGDSVAGTGIRKGEMLISSGREVVYPVSDAVAVPPPEGPASAGRNYDIKSVGGKRYFVTYIQSPSYGWVYQNVIPFDHIFNRIVWMKRMMLILFPVSLLIVIVVALSFAGSITRPIEALMGKMKRVQSGQIQSLALEEAEAPQAVSMDEVGQLQRTFRMMIRQIDELITENYKKQLTIKETQFRALQAQINPHFLYNTLDSINWLAKVNGQQEISNMVEALGHLFRHSISITDTLVTVEQELVIAFHYITIQRCRFEDRLLFRTDVPEAFLQHPIPKLTLQPLLENAIHYGLEPLIEPCLISIRAYEKEGKLVLLVADEGQGMAPERLDEVRRGDYVSAGRGIGLKNIDERIKLAFGDGYGIEIESSPGAGTKVYITLPL
jgi:two-component system sensor histidine kinase YesM